MPIKGCNKSQSFHWVTKESKTLMSTIGTIPEFTTDEGQEEVKETTQVEVTETPAELPAEPSEEVVTEPVATSDDNAGELSKQVVGLKTERERLLAEIQSLRGQRRDIKQQELAVVEKKIDVLADVSPDDVGLVDKIIKAKGYITKAESEQMFYDVVKQQEIDRFLSEFPEYKPENDIHDVNWTALERHIKEWYKMPSDAKKVGDLLRKAHRDIAKAPSDTGIEVKKQQVKTASVGSGGAQRSSTSKSLDPDKRALLARGGWSEEDIKAIEAKL